MAYNLQTEKKVMAVSMLAEGNSIRSIERMTGVHRDTIMRLGVRVGTGCSKILDQKMIGLKCSHIECDEIWGFIGAKRNHADAAGCYGDDDGVGFYDHASVNLATERAFNRAWICLERVC